MKRIFSLTLLFCSALTACASRPDSSATCRAEWFLSNGESRHGEWTDEETATKIAQTMALIYDGAAVLCRPQRDPLKWTLFAADMAVRTLDAYSTHRMLGCTCNYEASLPPWIANHPATMYAYSSVAVPAAILGISSLLERHGHRKLARLPFVIDIAYDAPLGIQNMKLRSK